MEINFSNEEIQELKKCINEMIASRIQYGHAENNNVRKCNNEKYLELDYKLLDKILKVEKEYILQCISEDR